MSRWSRLFACLALVGCAFVAVVAVPGQEKDNNDEPEEKKALKKSAKAPPEEKLVYGQVIAGKIKRFASGGGKEMVLEVLQPDPEKILNFNRWQQDQLRGIATVNPRDFRERQRRIFRYQQDLAIKKANPNTTMTPREFELQAAENMKVRILYPPIEYTDKGFPKKWTAKELAILKGRSRLPGYPSEFEALRPGHFVDVYLAKIEVPKGPRKKLDIDFEPGITKPEAVMIVIKAEPMDR